MYEMVSQQENRPLSFRYQVCFFSLRARVAKNLPAGPSSSFENDQQWKEFLKKNFKAETWEWLP